MFCGRPKVSKVTCIIFTYHLYRKGDAQQKCVTFVRVTLGCFLHSVGYFTPNYKTGYLTPITLQKHSLKPLS